MTARRAWTVGATTALVCLAIVLIRNAGSTAPDSFASKVKQTGGPARAPGDSQTHAGRIPSRAEIEGQPALVAPAPDELATDIRPPLANLLGNPSVDPANEPKIVLQVLDAYRRMLGAYPAGENNQQLVNALLGANKEKMPFLPRDHPRLNAKGEIVDAWGTPFFFHLNSRSSIEVRSAGADRVLFTGDDAVAGAPPLWPEHPVAPDNPPPAN